jgi:hypothetical protein
MHWVEEDAGKTQHGEGISRAPAKAKTKLFDLIVRQPGARPMKFSIPAETAVKAKQYAAARWPLADIELVGS